MISAPHSTPECPLLLPDQCLKTVPVGPVLPVVPMSDSPRGSMVSQHSLKHRPCALQRVFIVSHCVSAYSCCRHWTPRVTRAGTSPGPGPCT
jgi:hypothetical protein